MNRAPLLFLNVLIVATCGLVYELLAGTLASYVLGDSITQFSLIIGIYLSALGVGAWLSGMLDKELARRFIDVELSVALLGGLSAPLLFMSFAKLSYFTVILFGEVFLVGTLVGLEIPLLMRILKDNLDFKALISRVLTFDYIGALFASLLFPLFCVPKLGLVRTSLVFGMMNAAVALWGTWIMRPLIKGSVQPLRIRGAVVATLLIVCLIKADALTSMAEDQLFVDDVIHAKTTPYQRIVVTRGSAGFQLFLNGNLQFASADEYRYHEALVHPAMAAAAKAPERVLVLGGGDGLGLREILKHDSVREVTLVDLDPAMTGLSKELPILATLNQHAFDDPRVHVVNADAMIWLEDQPACPAGCYDAAIVDFPDPNNFALGKLYTTRFYKLLKAHLTPDAAVSVQTTSPLFARTSYWCVIETMEAAGFSVRPYHTTVPSFGVWGFALARARPFDAPTQTLTGLRYLTPEILGGMFVFSADMARVQAEVNRLDNQVLVRYYEREWRKWN
ncbi:MAG: polyamine aminopropyltransferase [Deltaproteobacteria bacterium]|nr:polyamine aminopropyltransferase [Deltaproteobacteria bacterium]